MSRNHTGFALFMLLLLIAPQIPIRIPGGIENSSVSLGIAGLVLWYLAYPERLFYFPRISISHPLFWIIIFAIYAFIVSLISTKIVSIAYSVQFLAYTVLGIILLRRYTLNSIKTNFSRTTSILIGISVIYSLGMIISLFTGPMYPHQTMWAVRHWGGFYIPQAVGFSSEGQNMAGGVVIFFIAVCIYLYHGKPWKKLVLLGLLLLALVATLSRSAIFSFIVALSFVYCLDSFKPFVQRAGVKVSVLNNIVFVTSVSIFLIILIGLGLYLANESLFWSILSGFGLAGGSKNGLMAAHMVDRFNLWMGGLEAWSSKCLLKMVFGGGFRSSMTVTSIGSWGTTHSMYITILKEFGVIGLVFFLFALLRALLRYIHLILIDKAGGIERFGLMAVLALSIHNITGEFFYSPVCLSLLIFTFASTL